MPELAIDFSHVGKRYGNNRVIDDFSCRILRGDKVGLIGPNGSGKTTLLKLILGELEADAGKVRLGTKLSIAYFDQFRETLDEEATLSDTISPGSDFVEVDGVRKHVISYLGDFLFPPARANAPVKALSGGERNRLLLARLFTRSANVLVLDEPTNDLDIETLELLEDLLQDYTGTLFLVSHDRVFLDNVVTQTIVSEGNGAWKEYAGGYTDWQRAKNAGNGEPETGAGEKKPAKRPAQAAPRSRLSYKENRELSELPEKMQALESEQQDITARLADTNLYKDHPAKVKPLQARFAEIEEKLLQALQRWEELEAKK